jgi:hypothetical protein
MAALHRILLCHVVSCGGARPHTTLLSASTTNRCQQMQITKSASCSPAWIGSPLPRSHTTRTRGQSRLIACSTANGSSGGGNGTAARAQQPGARQATPAQDAGAAAAVAAGPRTAFVPGREAESRQQLFNSISPVYDEVRGWCRLVVACSQPRANSNCEGRLLSTSRTRPYATASHTTTHS